MPGPPVLNGPFTMPMFRDFVPRCIQPWIYLVMIIIFQLTGSIYLGSINQMMGSTCLMREDLMMIGMCNVVGVCMPFPLLFRFKFRFTNRQLLLNAAVVILVCNVLCLYITSVPLLCIISFIAGFFKLCGTFECTSNIQLWMTPKRDFTIFFPLLYPIVIGDISLQGWFAESITYYFQSWQMMQWFIIGLMLLVILIVYTLTKNFRFMKPLPLISVDWLGCLLWSLMMIEVIFLFTYGEYYNWWDGKMFRLGVCALIVTSYFCIRRMTHIRNPYIAPGAWKYKTLIPLLFLFAVTELMNSTPKSLQNVFTGGVLQFGMMTTSILSIIEWIGAICGCLFVLFWIKVLHQKFTRLLIVGFMAMLSYQVMMYLYISPELNIERLYLPIWLRTFGYAIFFTALTIYLEELMPFEHFFMGITITGLVRNGVAESICTGVYSYGLRHQVADNIVRTMPYDVIQSVMVAIKQLFGYTCIGGCVLLLIFLLYDVQPVRSTLKKMPYWNVVGRTFKKVRKIR